MSDRERKILNIKWVRIIRLAGTTVGLLWLLLIPRFHVLWSTIGDAIFFSMFFLSCLLLVLPWRHVRIRTLWWGLFAALTVSTLVTTVMIMVNLLGSNWSDKRLTRIDVIVQLVIILLQLPAIWSLRMQRQGAISFQGLER